MTEEALRQLDKEDLIRLFLNYQERMEARVRELEQRIEELMRPEKTSENSSKPPSSGFKANRPQRGRKERKKGRVGKSRKRVKADVVIECHVAECADCGADLRGVPQRLLGSSQVVECRQ
ncbi:MAG: hypothetical protein J5I90_17525 [Caldilineales bacterium]|nr:hypothetical protein [Caldilineales bacterium]